MIHWKDEREEVAVVVMGGGLKTMDERRRRLERRPAGREWAKDKCARQDRDGQSEEGGQ